MGVGSHRWLFLESVVVFQTTIFAVCTNHEVVVFQPKIGTAPDLDSVANYTFYSNSPAPPVSTNFLDILIYPLYPTSPGLVVFSLVAPLSCA